MGSHNRNLVTLGCHISLGAGFEVLGDVWMLSECLLRSEGNSSALHLQVAVLSSDSDVLCQAFRIQAFLLEHHWRKDEPHKDLDCPIAGLGQTPG